MRFPNLTKLPTLATLTGTLLLALSPNQTDAQERIIASWNLVENTQYHQEIHNHQVPYNNRTFIQTRNGWHEQINRGCTIQQHIIQVPHTTYEWQLQHHNQPRINLPQRAYLPKKRCDPIGDLLNGAGDLIKGVLNVPGKIIDEVTRPCSPPRVHIDIQVTPAHPMHYNYRH